MNLICGHVNSCEGSWISTIMDVNDNYAVCGLKHFRKFYWIVDANDMQYVDCTYYVYTCTKLN